MDIDLLVYEFTPPGFSGDGDNQDGKILWIAAPDAVTARAVAPEGYEYWDNVDGVKWNNPDVDVVVLRSLPT